MEVHWVTDNASTHSGFLTPTSDPPDYDQDLERQISRWIRGVSGLPAEMVFPRWTDPQPKLPLAGSTWCAFGVTGVHEDVYPAFVSNSDETETQWLHEVITVICCFYGPSGAQTAALFRSGLYVPQNNAELNRVGLTFKECGRLLSAPELINNQWLRRYDLTVSLRRKAVREYAIKSFLEAPIKFFGD
ncbi:hypothetical protein HBA19_14950 [Hafnia alvei]|nr:hypothetical protein HBA19_14950 [Hafnia alvei]